jgi:hypothetical protein
MSFWNSSSLMPSKIFLRKGCAQRVFVSLRLRELIVGQEVEARR